MVILHQNTDDPALFCVPFLKENLYISLPEDSPLASKDHISLEELQGLRILMDGNVGFWKEILFKKGSEKDLLIQSNFDAFSELVEASKLPLFNTDQYIHRGYTPQGRISIPIRDDEAHITYWLAALNVEQKKYRSIFNAIRGNFLKNN